jgi:hypothetical protein
MKIGDVDERDVPERIEAQQISLTQLLLSKGARPATGHDRRRSGCHFKKLAPRGHDETTSREDRNRG